MYKSRPLIWVLILIVCGALFAIKTGNDSKTDVRFASDNVIISRNVSGVKLDTGAKVVVNQNNWEIYLSENAPLDGYKYEEYYSPIVIIAGSSWCNSAIFPNISNTLTSVYTANFKKLLEAYKEDKTFREAYDLDGYSSETFDKEIKICADASYEKEIKQTMLMAFAGTDKLTEEDCKKYGGIVNGLWNKMEKSTDITNFINDDGEYYILTSEYNIDRPNSNHYFYPVSITPSVGIKFYMNYKEGYEDIAKATRFMRYGCIRRNSYEGVYKKGYMKYADWSTKIVDLNEDINDLLKSTLNEEPETNTQAESPVTQPAVKETADSINISENTEEVSLLENEEEKSETQSYANFGEWNIIKKDNVSNEIKDEENNVKISSATDTGETKEMSSEQEQSTSEEQEEPDAAEVLLTFLAFAAILVALVGVAALVASWLFHYF